MCVCVCVTYTGSSGSSSASRKLLYIQAPIEALRQLVGYLRAGATWGASIYMGDKYMFVYIMVDKLHICVYKGGYLCH